MSDQDPPRHDPGYDPFDTEHRPRGRPVAGPRLPDPNDKPPPPDPSQRAAPRPHQPWPKVRPEDIVPPEDNPMRGWRGIGLATLSRDLWPKDARSNPIMAYYTGRKRGRLAEDLLGLSPWLFVLVIDFVLFFGADIDVQGIVWAYGALSFTVLFVGAALIGAAMTGFHLRRCMDSVPVDELLLTRMKPEDIVQGLSVRPIAVQSAGILIHTVLHSIIVVAAAIYHDGIVGYTVLSYAVLSLAVRWYLLGVVMELGAAISLRANFCIRRPVFAIMRTLYDLALAGLILGFLFILIGIGALLFFFLFAFVVALLAAFILVIGSILLGLGILLVAPMFAGMIRSMAGDAMEFCYLYPEEWWMRSDEAEITEELRPRKAFAPWRPIPGRRRIFGRPAVMPPMEAVREEAEKSESQGNKTL